jgi:ubiquinone/menaquinone biosynthesis C-methylase UbiE
MDAVPRDEETVAYFDQHVPEYGSARLEPAARFIKEHAGPGASLIDLGCGTGNTLEYLMSASGIVDVAGLDVSSNCLSKVEERLGCKTYLGSILDKDLVDRIGPNYDFAVVAAVLHHLIGGTRSESARHAELAVANSKRVLKPGGHLIVHEPIYYPAAAMSALFYLKKGLTRVTSRRVGLFGYWNNIGPPVVSYYTNERLEEIVQAGERADVVDRDIKVETVPTALRPVLRKTSTTLILRKP